MEPAADLVSPPRRRITPVGVMVAVFVSILMILMIIPSAKGRRIIEAKRRLATEFPTKSEESMKALLGSHLLTDGKFIYDAGQKECAILILSPNSTAAYSPETMLGEASRPLQYYYSSDTFWEKVPVALLLAPEENSPNWTIFSKIWIAKILQKQKVEDLKQLGLEISTNKKSRNRLAKIWAKQPPKIKARATQILEENRKVARQYLNYPRFYRNKTTYAISKTYDMSDFIGAYMAGHPELYPNYVH